MSGGTGEGAGAGEGAGGAAGADERRYPAMEGIRPLAAGDPVWIGPYPLLGRLGAGGMGRVFLARSPGGRTVAVKVVHEEHIANGEFRARFRREIANARRVGGSWTAPVLDADADAEQPWVATGYVPGPSLEQAVREHGPLPVASVYALAEGLARALRGIHAAGIVHRDLKPSNVLLTADGPRVIDFGIARAFQVSVESLLTSTGMVIGSPGFMAPEQVLGEETGPGADVFSLGCVLMYAATGQLPFGAGASNQHAVMFRIVQSPPDLTPVADARLRTLIERCLAKSAAERPPVDVLVEELAASASVPHGAWLPPVLLARLARQSALLLDADVPQRAGGPESWEVRERPGGPEGAGVPERAVDPGSSKGSAGSEGPRGAGGTGAPDTGNVSESGNVAGAGPEAGGEDVREAAAGVLPRAGAGAAAVPGTAAGPGAEEVPGAEGVPGGGEPARTPASAVSDPRTPPAPRDLGTVDLRPGPVKGAEPSPASAPVTAAPVAVAPGGRSRRRRVWVVAAVVVAVLAAGGTTAFLNRDPGGSAAPRGGEAATPPGAGDAPSGPAAAPAGKGEDGAKDGAKEKGTTEEGKGEGAAEGRDADGEGGGSAPGGGSGEGGSADAGAGGADGGRGGAGPSASGGSGDDAKPPASDPGPAPDGRVPSHFVGTWSIASRYDVLQPHTVVIRRVSPGGSAVTLVADVQGTGHCEYTAKLDSVTDGGKRINVGAGVVDRGRSGGMCRDTDPSFFTVAGSGILHDVGPAHGSGYRYDRA